MNVVTVQSHIKSSNLFPNDFTCLHLCVEGNRYPGYKDCTEHLVLRPFLLRHYWSLKFLTWNHFRFISCIFFGFLKQLLQWIPYSTPSPQFGFPIYCSSLDFFPFSINVIIVKFSPFHLFVNRC